MRNTPSFNSIKVSQGKASDFDTHNPYQSVTLKSWNIPSARDLKKPITRKLNGVHMRSKLTKELSFNSSRAQSDSGYDTVASVSTAADSVMPREA